jgi:hypothetical protein
MSAFYRFGTAVPQPRQVSALRWMGLPQRGQTRKPASALRPGASMGISAVLVGLRPLPFPLARCDLVQASSIATSAVASSSVGDSGLELSDPPTGTGTTRPQSGHLPCEGRSMALTFSLRPHGQLNRRKSSPGAIPDEEASPPRRFRMSRTFAEHLGQMTCSAPPRGISSGCPHRQVAPAIGGRPRAFRP